MTGSFTVGIFLVSVCAAIVSFLSPDGEMKKYVRLVASLAVLASIAVPLIFTAAKLPAELSPDDFTAMKFDGGGSFDIISLSAAEIEKSVKSMVASEFSLDEETVSVDVRLSAADTSAVEISGVEVTVPPGVDKAAVMEYVNGLFKNTTSVYVKEGVGGG